MPTFDDDANETDEMWPGWERPCQACDCIRPLNDLMLCDECADKLDRDLIRQRDWEYSALVFGVPAEHREALRHEIIAQFGAAFELILPPEDVPREAAESGPASPRRRTRRQTTGQPRRPRRR
jgi:hypothetical protein